MVQLLWQYNVNDAMIVQDKSRLSKELGTLPAFETMGRGGIANNALIKKNL